MRKLLFKGNLSGQPFSNAQGVNVYNNAQEVMTDEEFEEVFKKSPVNETEVAVQNIRMKIIDKDVTSEMRYAKTIYKIRYKDFTDEKYQKAARVDLGIDDESKLIPMDERKKNFELFKENHFTNIDNVESYSGNEPEPGMKAYDEIKKYALSSYGSLMIKKILAKPETPKFLIGASESHGVKASGEYKRNFIVLPANFPSSERFDISKQKILGVAIIHHEFEHTKHGQYNLPKSIEEEYKAVRFKENPVRIINGYEPRYVYYDFYTKQSINIITKEKQKGKWTFDKKDPSKPMIEIK